jgi:hypothetical protein
MSESNVPAPAPAPAPNIHFPWWVEHYVFPALKPEVDSLTAAVKADEPNIVAEIDALVGSGQASAEAVVSAFLAKVKIGGILGIVWGEVEPQIASALAAELTQLGGAVSGNAQSVFDTLYARLVAFEAAVGL